MVDRMAEKKPLSDREKEVVSLVVQGDRNKEVAQALSLSEQTVKNHLRNIFRKLGVSGRRELPKYVSDQRSGSSASGSAS